MSTQTPVADRPQPDPAAEPPDPLERFIDQRLDRARRQVKGVDLAAGLMTLAVGVLVYTLLVSVLDHWVVYGGLGVWGRLLAFGLLLAGAGWFAARAVFPPLVRRINPVFAAYTLEQSRPSIKNSLINFLLLRARRREVSRVIYRALEQRAVTDLRQVEIEAAVDRRHVLRLGYVLAATFALFCLYVVLSPKSPMVSAARLFAPWADIPAPSRVRIERIEPGDAVVFQGDFQTVTAEVHGLRTGEEVLLHYSTADGQSVDQVVPLVKDEGDYRYRCNLPPGSRGFQQDWQYRLSAGDALSRWFHIRVEVPPVIEVESVRYDYPAYTRLAPRTVARQGDIRAIEGTRVSIQGRANRPVQRAEIDLGCDGRGSVAMNVDDRTVSGGFLLRFSRSDPSRPQDDCYQLRFIDQSGNWNPRPVRYQIDVTPDLPPRVEIVTPEQDVIRMGPNDRLPIGVRAEDADFGLRKVVVRTSRDGQALRELPLLVRPASRDAWEGRFEGTVEFRPDRLGLEPGAVVMLWAEAEDNKEPSPNVAASARQRIEIIGEGGASDVAQPGQQQPGSQPTPAQPSAQPDTQARSPQPGQPPGEQPEGPPSAEPSQQGSASEQAQPGEPGQEQPGGAAQQPQQGTEGTQGAAGQSGQGEGPPQPGTTPGPGSQPQQQPGQPGTEPNQPSQPIDPEANPGDAFERILQHRQEELAQREPGSQEPQQSGPDQQGGQQQPGSQQQPGAQPGSQQGTGQQQPGSQQQPGAQPGSQQQGTGQQQPGAQPGSQQQGTGQQQPGSQQQPGAQPGSQQGTGQQQPGSQQQPGAQPGSQQQGTGQQQPGAQPGSQQQRTGQQQPGSQQQPGAQPGSQQGTGQQQPGAQPGSQQQGTGQQQPGAQPGSQQGTGQQQPGAQPGSQQGTGQQQPGSQQQPGAQPGSQQGTGQQPGTQQSQSPQGQPTDQGTPADSSAQQGQPQPGTEGGSPPSGGSEQGQGRPPTGSEPSGQGSQPQTQPQSPGQGEPSQGPGGTTSPQEGNRERPKESGQSGQSGQPQQSQGSGQSPSTSPRQSDSSGDTGGDRSGGGEQGGGQQAQQPGEGSPGSQTPADTGGGASAQPGQGPAGSQPGDRVPSTRPGARPGAGQTSEDSGRPTSEPGQGNPSGRAAERVSDTGQPSSPAGRPGEGQTPGSRPGAEPGTHGYGNPTSGGSPGLETPDGAQPEAGPEPGAQQDPDLEFARRQTALALEHLKEQMEKQDSDLFDRLGWDREQARRFLEQWEAMQRAAAQQDAEGQAARERLNEALKSLGLRPRGLELGGGQSQVERLPQLREAGRFEPPPQWSEQVREYLRGIAEGGR